MSLYNDYILPHLIALAMQQGDLATYRRRVIPGAGGRVLEIGIGSGLNLPFYGPDVTSLVGLEPSKRLLGMTSQLAAREHPALPITLLSGSGENIPLEASSFDTVAMTWTLCSVSDAGRVLAEIRRVLKPAGALLFVEHGLAPEPSVAAWQGRLTPVWKRIAGGCHLNRDVEDLLGAAGFRTVALRTGFMRGPRPFTFMSEGRAVVR